MIEDKIMSKKKFSDLVEKKVSRMSHLSYIDACVDVCEQEGFPPEDVGKLISPSLYAKIEAEASRNNLVKTPMHNTTMLPI
jgi:hypothetical protein